MDKLIRVSAVAEILGYDPESIYRRIRTGVIPPDAVVRYGRTVRLKEAAIGSWLAEMSKPHGADTEKAVA